jgi:parallel beta-helix repeat protein
MRMKLFFCLLLSFQAAYSTNYYVGGKRAKDTNAGTAKYPFETLQKGIDQAEPGDVVIVRNGVYNQAMSKRNGNAANWITIRAEHKHGAHIKTNTIKALTISHNYLEINGFEVSNASELNYGGNGISVYGNHHVRVLNNLVHHCGGNGIDLKACDNIVVEYNICHNNSTYNMYQTSGISVYMPKEHEGAVDYGMRFRYNTCYNNTHTVLDHKGNITDGNGIIIDNTKCVAQEHITKGTNLVYNKWILVEGNVCYNNGGAGVTAYLSNKVLIRNNTCYQNRQIDKTNQGEIVVGSSDSTIVVNNICVAKNKETKSLWSYYGKGLVFQNNLVWIGSMNGLPAEAKDKNFVLDPQFVSTEPSKYNFSLKKSSPAIDKGSHNYGLSAEDITGKNRVNKQVDIGAYEMD